MITRQIYGGLHLNLTAPSEAIKTQAAGTATRKKTIAQVLCAQELPVPLPYFHGGLGRGFHAVDSLRL